MLAPGFTVRELPVKLTSLNNIEQLPDGRLFAGGYDGRFHFWPAIRMDGLEDRVDTFWPETSELSAGTGGEGWRALFGADG